MDQLPLPALGPVAGWYVHVKRSRDGRVLLAAWPYPQIGVIWADEMQELFSAVLNWDELYGALDEVAGAIYAHRERMMPPGDPDA
jgi:hypothetical protein